MRKKSLLLNVVLLSLLCLIPFRLSANEVYIDGYEALDTEVQEYHGLGTAPSVSPSSKARIYYDTGVQLLELSVNSGVYSQILTLLSGNNIFIRGDSTSTTSAEIPFAVGLSTTTIAS